MFFGIDAHDGAAAGGPGGIAGAGATAAPVAHVGFGADEDDSVGRDADGKRAANFPGGGVEFEELVGEIAADVETRAVGGEGEAAGDFFFAARGVGEGQRHTVRRGDGAVGGNGEDLEAAVDIAQDEAASVRCEYEAGVADLALGVGLEDLG